MPVLSLDKIEKLNLGGSSNAIGILQSDTKGHKRNAVYLMDTQTVQRGSVDEQRHLYHTEFDLDDRESPDPYIGRFPYKRIFYNLYDIRDTAGKTLDETSLHSNSTTLWKLNENSHHDNYCPVLSSDPADFTGRSDSFFVLTKRMRTAPLIKTTDLLTNRSVILDKDTERITTTEWSYQISSTTVPGTIPTYGYAALSNLNYPGLHIPISSLYINVDSWPLSAAVARINSQLTIGALSSRINAVGATDYEINQLTSVFGVNWQEGIVSGRPPDIAPYEGYTLCSFYSSTINFTPYFSAYVSYMGEDAGISTLLVNKYNFTDLDYNYIYWTYTNRQQRNQFEAGEAWFDMLYGKNSYTARYSQQFNPDDVENAVPGNFNRARDYSGIGFGGGLPYLKYYDDMNYNSEKGAMDVVVRDSDFSTTTNNSAPVPNPGDEPLSSKLDHQDDITSSEEKTQRSYPHIEQLKQFNVLANRSMHPSNLYKIELQQDYLSKLFKGIYDQYSAEEAVDHVMEIQTNIKNSIRRIAKKFAPATTELLTVEFPD